MRRLVIGHIVFGHVEDHLAAALERPHLAQAVSLAIEHADARGTVKLVAGHDVPVAIDIAHVDRHVNRALRAIDKHRNAALMGDAADFLDRHDGAQRIRHMGDGNELGALRQAFSKASIWNAPSSSTGTQTSFAPCRSRMKCHGTMLE